MYDTTGTIYQQQGVARSDVMLNARGDGMGISWTEKPFLAQPLERMARMEMGLCYGPGGISSGILT